MERAKDLDIERELRADTRLENRQNRKQRENAGIAETPSGYASPNWEKHGSSFFQPATRALVREQRIMSFC